MPKSRAFVNGNDLGDVYLFSTLIVREFHGVGAVRTAPLSFSSDPCHQNGNDECQSNPTETIVFSNSNRSHRGLSLLFDVERRTTRRYQITFVRLSPRSHRPCVECYIAKIFVGYCLLEKRNSNCLYRKQDWNSQEHMQRSFYAIARVQYIAHNDFNAFVRPMSL